MVIFWRCKFSKKEGGSGEFFGVFCYEGVLLRVISIYLTKKIMKGYPPEYWDAFYENGRLGWDIGYVSTPLKEYFDQLTDKSIKILVPGAGNGWEVEYLYGAGFENVFILDFSPKAVERFKKRFPSFPQDNILEEDFFDHNEKYNLIVEQTFFSSLPRNLRPLYVDKMHRLLKPEGKLVGLLFNHEFSFDEPPFGGTPEEYRRLFEPLFKFKYFDVAYNSIKPRMSRELFVLMLKK
jgi:SAM-dependent methyltransferase